MRTLDRFCQREQHTLIKDMGQTVGESRDVQSREGIVKAVYKGSRRAEEQILS